MAIKKEDIQKALDELSDVLLPQEEPTEEVSKAEEEDEEEEEAPKPKAKVAKKSEPSLDNPEGDDLGAGHMGNKMSDSAKEGGSGKEGQKKMKDAKKSFKDNLPDEIETKVEVSDFLKSLVNHTAGSIDNLREAMVKSQEHTDGLAEKVDSIAKSQAKLGVVLKALCEKVGVISAEPARAPKAETTISKSGVVERTFENPGAEEAPQSTKLFKSLSDNPFVAKSQISNALCDLVKSGTALDTDVIGFESGGYIRPELVGKLKEKLN